MIYQKVSTDTLFEVTTNSDINKRFDSSHPFWNVFRLQNENKIKRLGYYEIENIDNKVYFNASSEPQRVPWALRR